MVFGWGKKKNEEKPETQITQDKEIHLDDVRKIVNDLEQLRQSQTIAEIKALRNTTQPLIDNLVKIGNVLEKDNLNMDDVDKHLAIIVTRGKKQVIDAIKRDVVELPKISDIADVEKIDSTLHQILKKIGDVLGRQTRVIHIFAKKYASELKENLEVMNSNYLEIQKIRQNFETTKSSSIEIADMIKQIKSLKETSIENNSKVNEITQNIASFEKQIASIQDSIEKIKSSDDYKKYQTLQNDLDSFKNQKHKIKEQIDAQFTKISRPLSRYEYASSLDRDQKTLLTKLTEDPFDVLIPKNTDSIIIILENVRKGVMSGSISVKDTEKTLAYLTETEESLEKFATDVSAYFEKLDKMQNELKSLRPSTLIEKENDLSKVMSSHEDSQLKLETIQGEIDDISTQIPRIISNIEEKLRRFSSTRYTISQN